MGRDHPRPVGPVGGAVPLHGPVPSLGLAPALVGGGGSAFHENTNKSFCGARFPSERAPGHGEGQAYEGADAVPARPDGHRVRADEAFWGSPPAAVDRVALCPEHRLMFIRLVTARRSLFMCFVPIARRRFTGVYGALGPRPPDYVNGRKCPKEKGANAQEMVQISSIQRMDGFIQPLNQPQKPITQQFGVLRIGCLGRATPSGESYVQECAEFSATNIHNCRCQQANHLKSPIYTELA